MNFRTLGHKAAAFALTLPVMVVGAHAQTASDGISAALDGVDLSSIATKVGAVGLTIVAIALVFKGPDIAKRVIRKV